MQSTYTCTPSFAHLFSIFTSVVVYSRTTPFIKTKTKKPVYCDLRTWTWFCFELHRLFAKHTYKKAQRKKNAEHTHMYTIFFATFLLNIHVGCCLFSHHSNHKHKKKEQGVCGCSPSFLFTCCGEYIFVQRIYKRAQRKKMRSTHACTPSFATFFSIFTSVVVYSRTTLQIKYSNTTQ